MVGMLGSALMICHSGISRPIICINSNSYLTNTILVRSIVETSPDCSFYPVGRQSPAEGVQAYAQKFCCLNLVSVHLLIGLDDTDLFDIF